MEKARILIVDDNMSLCKTLSFILRRKGYAASIAKNGSEAITKIKKRPFDIIFMDIKMPFMNGVETYKKIKKIRPEATTVMMTAYAVEDLVQDVLKEGVYDIIYKPLDMEKVVSLIEKASKDKNSGLILVVDDDHSTCFTRKSILKRRGWTVGIAHTGEDAVTKAHNKKYNIILIDMKLPLLNGLETYLSIKKANPETVAIIMTAYHQEMADLVEEALNNNAYTCLYKPLDIAEMLKLIEEILKRR